MPERRQSSSETQLRVLTIGHSTRDLEAFIALLRAHSVSLLVDIRTVPRSRRNPQFNRDSLPEPLAESGIRYRHMPALGGLRKPQPDSPNGAWTNDSFRGFADYMQTPEFADNLEALISVAREERVAIMCAEAVPWRCHRSLIADALLARRVAVEHIVGATRTQTHTFTPWARVEGETVTYPAQPEPDVQGSGSRRSREQGRHGGG